MTQIGITFKETEPYPVLKKVIPKTNVSAKNDPNWHYSEGDIYSQPAKVASQTKHQTQPASQPANQPAKQTNKQNQPARQPNTDLVGESNAKNLVSGRKWPKLELLPKRVSPTLHVLESNSKNECFGKEWPKLVLLRRRHLQPASQGSQPNKTPNTTSQPASQKKPTSQATKYRSCRRK